MVDIDYDAAVGDVSDALEARIHALIAAGWELDDVVESAATLIATANVSAARIGAIVYAALMGELTGKTVVPATAPDPHAIDVGRLRRAVATVMAEPPEQHPTRLARLAKGETASAAHNAYTAALSADERVTGWTRSLDGEGCQLCVWWARGGQVWPREHRMPRHTGCRCSQRPVVQSSEPV